MAYVFNPDGTVDFIEEKIDSYGIIKPIGTSDPIAPSKLPNTPNRDLQIPRSKNKASSPTPKETSSDYTKEDIDRYFENRKAKQQIVPKEVYTQASFFLRGAILKYFRQKYSQHQELCRLNGWKQKPSLNTGKKQKKPKNKTVKRPASKDGNSTPKNTIGDIATIIRTDTTTNDNVVFKTPGTRKPKAGYALDYFGRVQKRDLLDEDKNNEFKQSQIQQSNYDYSNYDKEDDHDSFYDSNKYD